MRRARIRGRGGPPARTGRESPPGPGPTAPSSPGGGTRRSASPATPSAATTLRRGEGLGRSAWMLYQWVGISSIGRVMARRGGLGFVVSPCARSCILGPSCLREHRYRGQVTRSAYNRLRCTTRPRACHPSVTLISPRVHATSSLEEGDEVWWKRIVAVQRFIVQSVRRRFRFG